MIDPTHYTYRVTWSAEDDEFVGLCTEFPLLSFLAETQREALEGIMETVRLAVEDLTANGEAVPVPLADRHYSGKFQVRIPPYLHQRLTIEAAEQGVSLNRYVSAKLG